MGVGQYDLEVHRRRPILGRYQNPRLGRRVSASPPLRRPEGPPLPSVLKSHTTCRPESGGHSGLTAPGRAAAPAMAAGCQHVRSYAYTSEISDNIAVYLTHTPSLAPWRRSSDWHGGPPELPDSMTSRTAPRTPRLRGRVNRKSGPGARPVSAAVLAILIASCSSSGPLDESGAETPPQATDVVPEVFMSGRTLEPGILQGRRYQHVWNRLFFALFAMVASGLPSPSATPS